MARDFFGNPWPFDELSGKTTGEQIADQELLVEEIDNAVHSTRCLIQDVRDRGGRLHTETHYWRGGAQRARSVDLEMLSDTLHEQLADRDRQANVLQRMYTCENEAYKPPSRASQADFVNEWGQTLGLNRPDRERY